ncbi:MAG: GNAT family N-acetyltransferase [Myxococcales bacterium]|nr:GNAT family N-acetyltransferase [Myxococcales bacterium]
MGLTDPTGPIELATPRLRIREWRRGDWSGFQALNTDPRIMAWQIEEPLSPQAARLRFERCLEDALRRPRTGWDLAVALHRPGHPAHGEAIGFVHLWLRPLCTPTAALGYSLLPEHWGAGLATEAADAVVTAALTEWGLRRLIAGCFADNLASRRVLDKLGFRLTRTQPDRFRKGGRLRHDCRYVLDGM